MIQMSHPDLIDQIYMIACIVLPLAFSIFAMYCAFKAMVLENDGLVKSQKTRIAKIGLCILAIPLTLTLGASAFALPFIVMSMLLYM